MKAALVGAAETLAGLNVSPNAAILNPGDLAHARLQGVDGAGFWNDLTGPPGQRSGS